MYLFYSFYEAYFFNNFFFGPESVNQINKMCLEKSFQMKLISLEFSSSILKDGKQWRNGSHHISRSGQREKRSKSQYGCNNTDHVVYLFAGENRKVPPAFPSLVKPIPTYILTHSIHNRSALLITHHVSGSFSAFPIPLHNVTM